MLDATKRVLDIVSPYIKELSYLCISVLETVKKCKRHLNREVTRMISIKVAVGLAKRAINRV